MENLKDMKKGKKEYKSFFNNIRTLLIYIWFENWSELLIYMLSSGEKRKLIDTS